MTDQRSKPENVYIDYRHLPAKMQKHLDQFVDLLDDLDGKTLCTETTDNTFIDEGMIVSDDFVPAFNAIVRALTVAQSTQTWNWLPIDTRPLATGKYLVGHQGHQEVIHFLSPNDRVWMPHTKIGWQKDPAAFRATHCILIETPDSAIAAHDRAAPNQPGARHAPTASGAIEGGDGREEQAGTEHGKAGE